MEKIKFEKYKIKKKKNWKDKASELTKYYGKNCFWLFYKFHPYKIEQAHKKMIEEGHTEFRYLLQRLHNN